jgi:hypothetical protein
MTEPKESKSERHFQISLLKSFLRLVASIFLFAVGCIGHPYFVIAGALLFVAEILGVIEEL